jgi:hypothetical protein
MQESWLSLHNYIDKFSQKLTMVIYYKFMYSDDILQLEFKTLISYLNPG